MRSVMRTFFAKVMSQLLVPGPRYTTLRVMPGILGEGTTPTGGNTKLAELRYWNVRWRASAGAKGVPLRMSLAPSPPPVMLRPPVLRVILPAPCPYEYDCGVPLTNSEIPDHSQLSATARRNLVSHSLLAWGSLYTQYTFKLCVRSKLARP